MVPFDRVGVLHLPDLGDLDVWWLGVLRRRGVRARSRTRWPASRPTAAGRYLLDTVKGADLGGDVDLQTGRGTLVVDLNFAYNPSCAYDPRVGLPAGPAGQHAAPCRCRSASCTRCATAGA